MRVRVGESLREEKCPTVKPLLLSDWNVSCFFLRYCYYAIQCRQCMCVWANTLYTYARNQLTVNEIFDVNSIRQRHCKIKGNTKNQHLYYVDFTLRMITLTPRPSVNRCFAKKKNWKITKIKKHTPLNYFQTTYVLCVTCSNQLTTFSRHAPR